MQGCVFIVALFFVLAIAEYVLLGWTPMRGSFGLPIASAALASMAVTGLWGFAVALKRRVAIAKPPATWRDGDLVGITGRISSVREPLVSPASGTTCALYEYALREPRSGADGNRIDAAAFDGMAMAGCVIQAAGQRFGLRGFPILTNVRKPRLDSPEALERFATHLITSDIKPKPKHVGAMLRELGEVLADADGVVRHDQGAYAEFDVTPWRELYVDDPRGAVSKLAEFLRDGSFDVEESVVPENAEVTVFGRYRASDRTIDIGSGMKHAEHGLTLGPAAAGAAQGFKGSLVMLAIFGALAGAFHSWIGPALWASRSESRYEGRVVKFDEAIATAFGNRASRDLLVDVAQSDNAAAVILLTKLGADPNRGSGGFNTMPLQQSGSAATLKALLDAGADPNRAESNGGTALHRMVERGDLDSVKILLARGAKPDVADSYGQTPLMRAAVYGRVEIGRLLLAAHADANHKSKDGSTPLDEARANGHDDFVQLLRTTGEARETEVTADSGVALGVDSAPVQAAQAYEDALESRDTKRIGELYPSLAKYDWSSTSWDDMLSSRPVRYTEVRGFASENSATFRVNGPTKDGRARGLPLGFAMVRKAPGGEFDGWKVERQWIEWGEVGH